MAETNGTTSVWMETHKDGQYSPLARNIETDVCVIGAGISGLSTAYCLLREGRSVTILDAFHVGGGQTERTTAHLASAIDDRFTEIERMHGEEGSRLAADSHATAIDMIETIVGREKIACDFKRLDGFLFLGEGDSRDILKKESEAAKRAGLLDVQYHPKSPEVGFDMGPCLRFPQQGQFHPMRYLDGLAKACERMGGQIHSHTRVDKVEGGKAAKITTASGALVTAKSVVVATNSPFIDQVVIHTKQALTEPMRLRCSFRGMPSQRVFIGIRSTLITMCDFIKTTPGAKTPTSSSSAAKITRPGKTNIPKSVSRPLRSGLGGGFHFRARSPIVGPAKSRNRWTGSPTSVVIRATTTMSILQPVIRAWE